MKKFKVEIIVVDKIADIAPVPGFKTIPFTTEELKKYLENILSLADGLSIQVVTIEEI